MKIQLNDLSKSIIDLDFVFIIRRNHQDAHSRIFHQKKFFFLNEKIEERHPEINKIHFTISDAGGSKEWTAHYKSQSELNDDFDKIIFLACK